MLFLSAFIALSEQSGATEACKGLGAEHDLSTAICCIFCVTISLSFFLFLFLRISAFFVSLNVECYNSLSVYFTVDFVDFLLWIRLQTTEKLLSKRLSYHLASKQEYKKILCIWIQNECVRKKTTTTYKEHNYVLYKYNMDVLYRLRHDSLKNACTSTKRWAFSHILFFYDWKNWEKTRHQRG